jgi:hypothetical protein
MKLTGNNIAWGRYPDIILYCDVLSHEKRLPLDNTQALKASTIGQRIMNLTLVDLQMSLMMLEMILMSRS